MVVRRSGQALELGRRRRSISVGREEFDVNVLLAQPLTARVATNGPTVRPTWFLWEEQALWILAGPWATLPRLVQADPAIALVTYDPAEDFDDLEAGEGPLRQQVLYRKLRAAGALPA
jgi:hypothetical protein